MSTGEIQILFLMAVPFIIIGGIGLYKFITFFIISLLRVNISVNGSEFVRGEIIDININLKPLVSLYISQIILKLECHRNYIYRDEIVPVLPSKQQCQNDVMAKTEALIEGSLFKSGEACCLNGKIRVSPDGMPTKLKGNLKTRWFLFVVFELPNFFNVKKKLEINVVDSHKKAIGTK